MVVPPADIILDVINDEVCAGEVVLRFYDDYIIAAAKEPWYGEDGEHKGYILNCDLAQDMRLAVLNCLPSLRKAFYRKFFRNKPMLIVISPKDIE